MISERRRAAAESIARARSALARTTPAAPGAFVEGLLRADLEVLLHELDWAWAFGEAEEAAAAEARDRLDPRGRWAARFRKERGRDPRTDERYRAALAAVDLIADLPTSREAGLYFLLTTPAGPVEYEGDVVEGPLDPEVALRKLAEWTGRTAKSLGASLRRERARLREEYAEAWPEHLGRRVLAALETLPTGWDLDRISVP